MDDFGDNVALIDENNLTFEPIMDSWVSTSLCGKLHYNDFLHITGNPKIRMTNQTIFFVLPDDETQQFYLKISDGQIRTV